MNAEKVAYQVGLSVRTLMVVLRGLGFELRELGEAISDGVHGR